MLAMLETAAGEFVAQHEIPEFVTLPVVLLWGSRVFVRTDGPPVWREAFTFHLGTADGSLDPVRHIVVTRNQTGREGATLFVRPHANLAGLRIESYEIGPDVELDRAVKRWCEQELRPRVRAPGSTEG